MSAQHSWRMLFISIVQQFSRTLMISCNNSQQLLCILLTPSTPQMCSGRNMPSVAGLSQISVLIFGSQDQNKCLNPFFVIIFCYAAKVMQLTSIITPYIMLLRSSSLEYIAWLVLLDCLWDSMGFYLKVLFMELLPRNTMAMTIVDIFVVLHRERTLSVKNNTCTWVWPSAAF